MTNKFPEPVREGTLYHFMNNIEKVLINDEWLMRLFAYKPKGFDEEKQIVLLDPLDENLPDIVNNSKEYWALVNDRIRKGDKRTDKSEDSKCIMYIQEGKDRSKFGNAFIVDQEVLISILIHENYETDWRMSRIRDRVFDLLIHKNQMAGFGMFEYVGADPREAPKSFRRMDYRFKFTNNKSQVGRRVWS